MKYGLSEATLGKIRAVLFRYPQVDQAIFYGSRAKGNSRTGSDIDLSLLGTGLTLATIFRILEEIDDLYLPYKFDLSILDDISDPDLISHIQRGGITVYSKGEAVPEPPT